MTRQSFFWSLLAMVLAPLGLRVWKPLHDAFTVEYDVYIATYPRWSAKISPSATLTKETWQKMKRAILADYEHGGM